MTAPSRVLLSHQRLPNSRSRIVAPWESGSCRSQLRLIRHRVTVARIGGSSSPEGRGSYPGSTRDGFPCLPCFDAVEEEGRAGGGVKSRSLPNCLCRTELFRITWGKGRGKHSREATQEKEKK